MIDNFKYLPRKTIIQLFDELFDKLPELQSEVAPDGWENSQYYLLFHYSEEEKMLESILDSVMLTRFRQRFGEAIYRSEEPFNIDLLLKNCHYSYKPDTYYPERELCTLLAEAISCLGHLGRFLHPDSTYFYEVNPPVAHKAAEIVARDKGILTDKPFMLPDIPWRKRRLIGEVNLIPFMRYLFRALPRTGFEWGAIDYTVLEFIEDCERAKSGNYDSDIPYYANDRDAELGITSTPKLEHYFDNVEKEMPSDATVAYVDVFGDWPKGFPPEKEFYLELYEKLKSRK